MRRLLTSSATFDTKRNRWKINVQKDGIRRSFYSSTQGRRGKAEAEAKAMEWLQSANLDDPTFEYAWEMYRESHKLKVGTSGQVSDEWAGRLYLLPALAKKKLSKITVQDWQDILDGAVKQGKAKATVNDIRTRITGFHKYCLKKRWPTESLEMLENNSDKVKPKSILARQSIKEIFQDNRTLFDNEVIVDPYWNAYRFAIVFGHRRGEVSGLQWSDLDGAWLTINRSINHFREVTNGKNVNARRTVMLPKIALKILEDQKAYLKENEIISPWIFPKPDGSQINPNNLYNYWQRYLAFHGIELISFHEIRHTMISYNKKMPIELLKAVAGHSESMDTTGTYGHTTTEDFVEAADDVEQMLQSILA